MSQCYRHLQVKDLPNFPRWWLQWDSNLCPSGCKAPNLPQSHHAHDVNYTLCPLRLQDYSKTFFIRFPKINTKGQLLSATQRTHPSIYIAPFKRSHKDYQWPLCQLVVFLGTLSKLDCLIETRSIM